MGFFNCPRTSDEIEDLAEKLALLYIEKSTKPISTPEDIANEFVEIQNCISDELKKFN